MIDPRDPDLLPAITSAEINALPKRVQKYIHDLETKCDPSGDIQTIWSQREQIAGLVQLVKELQSA